MLSRQEQYGIPCCSPPCLHAISAPSSSSSGRQRQFAAIIKGSYGNNRQQGNSGAAGGLEAPRLHILTTRRCQCQSHDLRLQDQGITLLPVRERDGMRV